MGQAKKGEGTLVHLSKSDMQRMPKPRAGFEAYVAQLVALAEAEPVLQSRSFDASAMLDELRAYQSLQAVVADATKQLALARETRFQHASNLWRGMLRIYQRAQAEAEDDPNIQYGIAAFEAFMKSRPRKRATPPATTTPPALP